MPDMIAHSRSSSSPGLRSVVQKSGFWEAALLDCGRVTGYSCT